MVGVLQLPELKEGKSTVYYEKYVLPMFHF